MLSFNFAAEYYYFSFIFFGNEKDRELCCI